MTKTMRERLCVAAAIADGDLEALSGVRPDEAEFTGLAVEHYSRSVDAILAELRVPDDEMKDAEYVARRAPLTPGQDPNYRTFTAMIDAVLEATR